MYCRKCGKEVGEGATFCQNCGTSTAIDKNVLIYLDSLKNKDAAGGETTVKTASKTAVKKSAEKKLSPVIFIIPAGVLLLLLAVGISIAVAVTISPKAKEKRMIKSAEKYTATQDYAKAVSTYETLIAAHPDNIEYYKALAGVYEKNSDLLLQVGNADAAADLYNKEFILLDDAFAATQDESINTERTELVSLLQVRGFRSDGTKIITAADFNEPSVDSSRSYSAEEEKDIALMTSIREAVVSTYFNTEVISAGEGLREGRRIAIDKLFDGNAGKVFLETYGASSFDDIRKSLSSEEALDAAQIYADVRGCTLSVYCGTLRVGESFEAATLSGGTYGDWAVTEAPVGFYTGGSLVLASKAAADAGKADGLKEIIEYVTLDSTENGIQYGIADASYQVSEESKPEMIEPENGGSGGTIELWSYSYELPNIVEEFCKKNPDFGYKVNVTVIPVEDGYQKQLDKAIKNGEADIYEVEMSFSHKYSQSSFAKYAIAYEDLGIDFSKSSEDSQTADYMLQAGTRYSDNKVVALGYQNTTGFFIYRRSIAKDVWGTDDPYIIKKKIGGGTGAWKPFVDAAEELKAKGYAVCSGTEDIQVPVLNSADTAWLIDKKLVIDTRREKLMGFTKQLYQNDYTNNTEMYSDAWYADMSGSGSRQVFGFFGDSRFIKDVLYKHCGNVPENDTSVAEAVGSEILMSENVCTPGILDGQDIFETIMTAGSNTKGINTSSYDNEINALWVKQVDELKYGRKTKVDAIEDFKKEVEEQLGFTPAE
ncbi:MAG: zinc-ribbon domain-containing protein [Lachnospiraceae bacterium]|nr:zinc-ribbon domain-containing protein [Lachnospiraceae bacterium]